MNRIDENSRNTHAVVNFNENMKANSDEVSIIVSMGVCAMAKKTKSKPMKEILRRLEKFQHLNIIVFEEQMIINTPIESWPVCDALISFYSDGFPLEKAIAYTRLRSPYLINDLDAQYILMNRKKVYEVLQSEGVPVPRYACVDRSNPIDPVNFIEHDDAIEIDGDVFHKPFVEKPLNAEDHNIYIYFPSSAGGGSQRLFRKVGDRSSKYCQISTVRTDGSYLYEEFMPTDGTDVKVYTVADDYAHAEARKSPALDGKVERDCEGKEIRYPVILTQREKIIAKKVAKVVKQQICGFDLLRANGMSYVCDVNGFSFVKTSRKYYDDCSHILGVLITRRIAPRLCPPTILPGISSTTDDDIPLVPTTCGTIMELRCVIAIFRHGDRTPKQKMKMEVRHDRFFQLFNKYAGGRTNELKLKKPKQLQEVLDIVRSLLDDIDSGKLKNSPIEKKTKLEQLRYVLEMYGSFSGINRKIQLKYQPNGRQSVPEKKSKADTDDSEAKLSEIDLKSMSTNKSSDPCILLIVKWGGELTAAGRQQAEELGRAFRCIYPGGDGNYSNNPGLGLLRLHSTFRHDLKIYASDEGRVQMTAAAFAKGFLALEGELPPILVQMVKSANTNGLLDNDNDCHQYQQMVKKKICEVMSKRAEFTDADKEKLAPTATHSLLNAMDFVRNPFEACTKLFGYVQRLANRVAMLTANPKERSKLILYHNESWDLLLRRWGKLVKDFRSLSGDFDVSKLPDIYDNIKYDIQHNSRILIGSEMLEFFNLARALADIVVPQEYGITKAEKLAISQRICTPLLRKILSDARYTDVDECTRLHAGYSKGVASPERFVRTRLYFTSESHLHSLLTCLQYGELADPSVDEQWRRAMDYVTTVPELNYLSQIVIMIYEDPTVAPKTANKFHVELHFSPGAHALCRDLPPGTGFRPGRREYACSPASLLSSCTSLAETSIESNLNDTDGQNEPSSGSCRRSPTTISTHKMNTHVSLNEAVHDRNKKRVHSACRAVSLERSLDASMHISGLYRQKSLLNRTISKNQPHSLVLIKDAESRKDGRCRHISGQVYTTSSFQSPVGMQSGLCYADIVNHQAVGSHCSRVNFCKSIVHQRIGGTISDENEIFSGDILRSMLTYKNMQRSQSSGPIVHHFSKVLDHSAPVGDNSNWHDKTITGEDSALPGCLSAKSQCYTDFDSKTIGNKRDVSPYSPINDESLAVGRFTVTCSQVPDTRKNKSPEKNSTRRCWYAHSVDLSEGSEVETPFRHVSHSTSEAGIVTPSGSPSLVPLNCTTPSSPLRRLPSFIQASHNSPSSRRVSFGDQPQDFFSLQAKTSDDTALIHTSLDSVRAERAQVLRDAGPPVAQWLMEYFDQIEKSKWTQRSRLTSEGDGRDLHNYIPLSKSTIDYLKFRGSERQINGSLTRSTDNLELLEDNYQLNSPLQTTENHEIAFGKSFDCCASENCISGMKEPAKVVNGDEKAVPLPQKTPPRNLSSENWNKESNSIPHQNCQVHLDVAVSSKSSKRILQAKWECGLISTAVIRGTRDPNTYSNSVPDLVQLMETSQRSQLNNCDGNVSGAPCVPEIYPLETLHNAMTLSQLEQFLARLTTNKFPSPFSSPRVSTHSRSISNTNPPSQCHPRSSACMKVTSFESSTSLSLIDSVHLGLTNIQHIQPDQTMDYSFRGSFSALYNEKESGPKSRNLSAKPESSNYLLSNFSKRSSSK